MKCFDWKLFFRSRRFFHDLVKKKVYQYLKFNSNLELLFERKMVCKNFLISVKTNFIYSFWSIFSHLRLFEHDVSISSFKASMFCQTLLNYDANMINRLKIQRITFYSSIFYLIFFAVKFWAKYYIRKYRRKCFD